MDDHPWWQRSRQHNVSFADFSKVLHWQSPAEEIQCVRLILELPAVRSVDAIHELSQSLLQTECETDQLSSRASHVQRLFFKTLDFVGQLSRYT